MHIRHEKDKKEFVDQFIRIYEDITCLNSRYEGPPIDHLSAFSLFRAYGGPEEGNWWFDEGTSIKSIPVQCKRDVEAAAMHIWDLYRTEVMSSRPYTSVLGGFDVEVHFTHGKGKDYPEERPHYE